MLVRLVSIELAWEQLVPPCDCMQLYQERSQSVVSCQESLFLGCFGRVQEDHLQVDLARREAAALQLLTPSLPCTAWPLAGITHQAT